MNPTAEIEILVTPAGSRTTYAAEIFGQLAIHVTAVSSRLPDGFTLSHIASGYRIWSFFRWVEIEQIRRLAEMLADQDFDAYMRDGYKDKAFIQRVKAIYEQWEETYPDRMAYDYLSSER